MGGGRIACLHSADSMLTVVCSLLWSDCIEDTFGLKGELLLTVRMYKAVETKIPLWKSMRGKQTTDQCEITW